ncbi:MAG: hypothetical protein V4577_21585 [Bacteroidota bacterium]
MENELPQFRFNILRILDSVFFVEEGYNPKPEDVKINFGMGFHFDVEEGWVQYNIRADFSAGEIEKQFVTGTVVTKFAVDNLKSFTDSDGSIMWPSNALEVMFSIAFTHMRALLAKNTAGTKFSQYIVPLVNSRELFKQLMDADPNFEMVEISEENVKNRIKTQSTK